MLTVFLCFQTLLSFADDKGAVTASLTCGVRHLPRSIEPIRWSY